MTLCPHCHRQRLYPSRDRTAAGTCISCGDVYAPVVDRKTAEAELRHRPGLNASHWLCPRCGTSFRHRAAWEQHTARCAPLMPL